MSRSSTTRLPRVLHVAFTCGPGRGSEPGVGWHRAVQAARFCEVWVITREQDCRQWIEQHQARHGMVENLHFAYLPLTSSQVRTIEWPVLKHLAQRTWQRRALKLARQLHDQIRFDLTHKTTYCAYREPSYLWQMETPFVWGPIGGTQNYPWRLLPGAGLSIAASEGFRAALNVAQLRTSRRFRRAARKASALLSANRLVARDIAKVTGIHSRVVSDVGVERVNGQPRGLRDKDQPLRILWVGVLQPWKAMDLLIDALAHVPMDVPCEVRVMGDGPMRGVWQRAARRKGVDQRITWLGRLPHDEVLRQYAWADAMAFTSLRDTTGTVIAEALAAGTPVIGIDHQGCADVVSPRCGLKVPVMSRPAMSRELARLLLRLAREPDLTSRLSRGALEQAEHYLWSEHGNRMAEVYNRVLEQAGSDCRCILDEENQLPTTRLSMPETSLAQ